MGQRHKKVTPLRCKEGTKSKPSVTDKGTGDLCLNKKTREARQAIPRKKKRGDVKRSKRINKSSRLGNVHPRNPCGSIHGKKEGARKEKRRASVGESQTGL